MLSGEGQHFCAGLDLAELSERTVYEGVLHSRMWHATLEKLQYELFYLKHQSPALDVRICARTVRSVVAGDGR